MIMNKKIYIAPAMEITEIEMVSMLAASPDVDIYDKPTDDDAVMSNRRRGTWGNLWN